MTRKYRKCRSQSKATSAKQQNGSASAVQLPLQRDELVELMQDALHSFATEMGLLIAAQLLEDEVTQRCGQRHERVADRSVTRHGRQQGVITLAGQKLHIERPRIRYTNGVGEAELATYGLLQRDEAMPQATLKRLVRGVSCRDYEGVVDLAQAGFGVKKSSVSRGFVKASAQVVEEFSARRFEGTRFVAIFIDGVDYAGETMVCALGITADGTKRILGLRQGATENKRVVTALLEELTERGVDTDVPTLFVLDGAKALHAAVKATWGGRAVIQRCQIHKKRNLKAHLAQKHWPELLRQLNAAYYESDYDRALQGLKTTARWLDRISPAAASSLREGMEETLTVIRLGIPERLRKTLASTNPI
ncbi:MAG: IS256 family transposase, partial [Planctomycetales bacterium]|nr:IS256 family transposase [Planctomycetales bacterium]